MLNFSGRVEISIFGAYCEDFLNELFERSIILRNITTKDGIIYAVARKGDYRKIAALSRLFNVRVRVVRKRGIVFRLTPFKKRAGILLGIIASCITILILERHIWHIEVHNNSKITEAQLLTMLEKYGVTLGVVSTDIDGHGIELKLQRELDDLGWIHLDINGSRMDVYISETNFPEEPEISLKTPCNIVSERDGVIVETEVYSGELLHKKGSGIAKGSVIVSGTVNDSAGNILLTHSSGKIIADFTEKLELYMPFTTIEKETTGKTETEKQLMLFGFSFPLYSEQVSRENKLCHEEIESFSFFEMELPWKMKTSVFEEYREITVTRTDKDVMRLLEQQIEMYCNDVFKEYEVRDISKNYYREENGIKLIADITLRGEIGKQQVIYEKNLTNIENSDIVVNENDNT